MESDNIASPAFQTAASRTKVSDIHRIPLIYIASNGRSGSTLLELVLNCSDEVWTMGEVQNLPLELRLNRQPDGSGKPIVESEFWAPLLPKLPLGEGDYPIEYFRDQKMAGRVLRWSHLPSIVFGRSSKKSKYCATQYGDVNARMMHEIYESALARRPRLKWLVDASKDPYRLLWLAESNLFDLRVIHIFKRPEAFVYSMTSGNPRTWRKAVRFSGRWLVENAITMQVIRSRFTETTARRVSYEILASKPEQKMADLAAWLGIDCPTIDSESIRKHPNFGISGNQMRRESRPISLDDRWRTHLPRPQQMIAAAFGLPLRYSLRKSGT